jgi:aryl-alcohol dehydrogenase-like predicted oxidoreductase
MEMRIFGRTGMQLSVLGFGCGAVGGLMVRGDPLDQERTIARAITAGVNYFDTAVQYGNGESEKNLGRVLQRLKPANVIVGTKVRLPTADFGRIADAVAKSLEGSLARLRLDRADILHLHNAITETGGGEALSVRQVLSDVVPAFQRLRQQGKTRFLGLTAVGDTAALHQVINARAFDSAQVVYNMLNPSAAAGLPAATRHRTMDDCSIIPERPASASAASACSPVGRFPDRPSVIRLRVRRPSRSARQ